jgi:acetoacetyl-CoA reductase/3-oxoacyl-[acyl-carrier protein] reductase
MTVDLSNRVAIVTGAAHGIGLAIALALVERGATVHAFDIASIAKDECPKGLHSHQVDIRLAAHVQEIVSALPSPPTLLVNNAGIARDRTIAKMTDDEWNDVLAVNLTGAFNCLRAVTPSMSGVGYGRVVNVTSINGLRGKFGQANYAASKAGLIGLTKTAARELGSKGITVNAVAPGMVMTDMALALPPEILDSATGETVTGRLPTVEDVVHGVMFLLSEAAGAITGQVLQIDSGQYI